MLGSLLASGGLSALGEGLSGLLGHQGYKQAGHSLDDIATMYKNMYNPYIQAGYQSLSDLQDKYGQLMDPTQHMADIMGHYQESPYAQTQQNELQRALGSTAAAGGFSGSPYHQHQVAQNVQNVLSKDMQNYLKDALGIEQEGISGEQGLEQQGLQSTQQLAEALGGIMGQQGELGFQEQRGLGQKASGLGNALSQLLSQYSGYQQTNDLLNPSASQPPMSSFPSIGETSMESNYNDPYWDALNRSGLINNNPLSNVS